MGGLILNKCLLRTQDTDRIENCQELQTWFAVIPPGKSAGKQQGTRTVVTNDALQWTSEDNGFYLIFTLHAWLSANPSGIIHTVRGFMETSFSLAMLMLCNGIPWMNWKGRWSIVIQKHLSQENKSSRVKTPHSMRIEAVRVTGCYMDEVIDWVSNCALASMMYL